jgi:hypothetical protein
MRRACQSSRCDTALMPSVSSASTARRPSRLKSAKRTTGMSRARRAATGDAHKIARCRRRELDQRRPAVEERRGNDGRASGRRPEHDGGRSEHDRGREPERQRRDQTGERGGDAKRACGCWFGVAGLPSSPPSQVAAALCGSAGCITGTTTRGGLELLPPLEPAWRTENAHAVTTRRITQLAPLLRRWPDRGGRVPARVRLPGTRYAMTTAVRLVAPPRVRDRSGCPMRPERNDDWLVT